MTVGRNRRSLAVYAWTFVAAVAVGAFGFRQGQSRAKDAAPARAAAAANKGEPSVTAGSPEVAGRYLIRIAGCNDCHTPGAMAGLPIPEALWLTGNPVGFRGPWGTTYGSNLRLTVKAVAEDDFVAQMRARNTRPPMPWASLHAMSDADLRAIYRYIKSLGAPGQPAPEFVPPDEEPKTPFVSMAPVFPKGAPPAKP